MDDCCCVLDSVAHQAKWHSIERGRILTEEEIEYICTVLRHWLEAQEIEAPVDRQMDLPLSEDEL